MSVKAHYVKECSVAGIITALISVGFFYLIFGGEPSVLMMPFFYDSIPQSILGASFAGVIPAFLTRAKVRAGKLSGAPLLNVSLPANPLIAGILSAILTAAVLLPLFYGLLLLIGNDAYGFMDALALKTAYGFVVGVASASVSMSAILKTA